MNSIPMSLLLMGLSTLMFVSTDASSCACSAAGDPHYRMCDGTAFDWQGEGTYTMFKNSAFDLSCSQRKLTSNAVVSYIDSCTLVVTDETNKCDMVIVNEPNRKEKPFTVNGELMDAAGIAKYMEKSKLGVNMTAKGNSLTVESNTVQDGTVKVIMAKKLFSFNGQQVRPSMGGLCGTGNGKEVNPGKNIAQIAKQFALTMAATSKFPLCDAVTSKPSAPSSEPTVTAIPKATNGTVASDMSDSSAANATTPSPTTSFNSTSASGDHSTSANLTTPFVVFKEANDSMIPEHPVFESEEVLKQVVQACMGGRSNETMETDKVFASFVENCVYDKSLGPGSESTAKSNLDMYIIQATANGTKVPALDLGAIMDKSVTKKPSEIKAGEGVTFELRLTKPTPTSIKADYLAKRSRSWSGAAQSESSSSENLPMLINGEAIVHKMRFNMSFEIPVIVLAAKKSEDKQAKADEEEAEPSSRKDKSPSKQRKTKIPISQTGADTAASGAAELPAGSAVPTKIADSAASGTAGAPGSATVSPTVAPATPIPTTPTPTTSAPMTSPPIKQVQIVTAMRARELPGAPIMPQQTMPPVFQQFLAQQMMQQGQQAPQMAQMPVQQVQQMQPAVQAIPVAAAPKRSIAAAPAVLQAPQMMQMQAKPTPEQEKIMAAQQAGQRQALQDQQNADRANLEREQKRAADRAKQGVKVQVPNPMPVVGMVAMQPGATGGQQTNGGFNGGQSSMNGARNTGFQGNAPAILFGAPGTNTFNGNAATNSGMQGAGAGGQNTAMFGAPGTNTFNGNAATNSGIQGAGAGGQNTAMFGAPGTNTFNGNAATNSGMQGAGAGGQNTAAGSAGTANGQNSPGNGWEWSSAGANGLNNGNSHTAGSSMPTTAGSSMPTAAGSSMPTTPNSSVPTTPTTTSTYTTPQPSIMTQ